MKQTFILLNEIEIRYRVTLNNNQFRFYCKRGFFISPQIGSNLQKIAKIQTRVKLQTRIFGPLCPSSPQLLEFAKNRESSELTQNCLKRRGIEKNLPLGDPPPICFF